MRLRFTVVITVVILLNESFVVAPTVVHEDNDAVMSFVENYDHVRQTKHLLVKVRYLQ